MTEEPPRVLTVSHLHGWETRWDQLVDRAPLPSPFLRSWWLTGAGGPHRQFLLAVRGARLMGGLALQRRHIYGLEVLRFTGSGRLCPDHLDLVTSPGDAAATVRLLRSWFERPGGRVVDLTGVSGRSRVTDALPGPVRAVPYAVAPWTPLPDDGRTYVAGLSSQLRRNLRRTSARLAGEGVTHRVNRGSAALRSLGTLRSMHAAQWGGRSRFLSQFDRFAAACRLGVGADEVAVHELAGKDGVVASVVTFEVAGRVSLYQSARLTDARWRSAMSVLLSAVISDACDRGFHEVDFLRGEETYKGGFAPERRTLFRLLAGTGATGRAARFARSTTLATRRIAEEWVRAGRAVREGRPARPVPP